MPVDEHGHALEPPRKPRRDRDMRLHPDDIRREVSQGRGNALGRHVARAVGRRQPVKVDAFEWSGNVRGENPCRRTMGGVSNQSLEHEVLCGGQGG